MKRKPTLIVKSSEWKLMSEATRKALGRLAAHVSSIPKEELDRIKNAPFIEAKPTPQNKDVK